MDRSLFQLIVLAAAFQVVRSGHEAASKVVGSAIGIEGMLENSGHEDAGVAGKYLFGAVAVMDVKIDDRDARQTPRLECVSCGDGDIVEEAETHCLPALGMMAGRADRAKGVVRFAAHHQVSGETASAGRPQRRLQGPGRHRRIRIEMHDAICRTAVMHMIYVVARMNTQQLLISRQGSLMELQRTIQPGRNQAILNGIKATRAFRVTLAPASGTKTITPGAVSASLPFTSFSTSIFPVWPIWIGSSS